MDDSISWSNGRDPTEEPIENFKDEDENGKVVWVKRLRDYAKEKQLRLA